MPVKQNRLREELEEKLTVLNAKMKRSLNEKTSKIEKKQNKIEGA